MKPVRIRACTHNDIDAVLQLDRQWEEEQIAEGVSELLMKVFQSC